MAKFELENFEFEEKVIAVNRVAKVVKGGRRFSFTALVAVGDKKGKVGIGLGKASRSRRLHPQGLRCRPQSYGLRKRRRRDHSASIDGKFGATTVMMRPASPGTGVIAGGAVRVVLETLGVQDILTKVLGSRNVNNVVKATMDGLLALRTLEQETSFREKA